MAAVSVHNTVLNKNLTHLGIHFVTVNITNGPWSVNMACRNVHHSLVNVGYSMNFTEYGVLMYLLVINDVVIITNINIINIYIQKVINYPPDLLPFSSFSSSVFSRISFLFVVQFSYKFFWPE